MGLGVPLRAERRRRDSNLIEHRVGYVLVIRKVAFNCHRGTPSSTFRAAQAPGSRARAPWRWGRRLERAWALYWELLRGANMDLGGDGAEAHPRGQGRVQQSLFVPSSPQCWPMHAVMFTGVTPHAILMYTKHNKAFLLDFVLLTSTLHQAVTSAPS